MKKVLLVLGLAAAVACGKQPEGFTISGNVKGLDGGVVEIRDAHRNKLDSVVVENGKFTAEGKIDVPQNAFVMFKNAAGKPVFYRFLYLENVQGITIDADATVKGGACTYAGAPVQAAIEALDKEMEASAEYKNHEAIKAKIRAAYDEKSSEEVINALYDELEAAKPAILDLAVSKEGADRNPAVVLYVYRWLMSGMDLDSKIKYEARFAADYSDYYLDLLRKDIALEKKLAIGQPAPDFRLKDLEGNEHSLAEFKGKYVYMEFSASWCGWCKKELPYIKEAYAKLKDKDIVFVTMKR